MILSGLLSVFLIFRGDFINTSKSFINYLGFIGSNFWQIIGKLMNKTSSIKKPKILQHKVDLKKLSPNFKKILENKLQSKKDIVKKISFKSNSPIQENTLEVEPQREISPKPERTVSEKDNSIEDTSEEKVIIKPARNSTQSPTFFESADLIECISDRSTQTKTKGPDKDYFQAICNTIEGKLNEFNVKGQIINILKGPVVDTFELELGEGIKASKVKGLEDDIGLSLNGIPIRVVYPLKGRSTIGIEVPRNPREFIYLDEVLQAKAFNESNLRLPVAMGKDAFGEVSIVDLAGMPHMLVAGATGAGKSVFINALLVSLIIKKSPKELRLILIDPKQLELALFSTLPHLLLPVITEAPRAAIALLWAVEEMDRRYSILKNMGVKNIEGFNKKLKTAGPHQYAKIHEFYEDADTNGFELPYIVIVIDEFADLILTKSGKEIEINVNRLAAKARAAGIHIVLATQRPSTDVITGVIKANFPTRIAFRVTTGHDSKTILDQHGAQKLLGRGDMLYKHGVDLLRLHSSFVDEAEVEVLVNKLSEIQVEFDEKAMDFLENGGEEYSDEPSAVSSNDYVSGTSDDPVYQEALQVVIEHGSASASMLQRRLRVGYNRAANIIDELEKNGIVGPAQGSKPRKILARSE